MKKGILLLALGHGDYGHMAATLAASIREHSDIPIHLIHYGRAWGAMSDKERSFFTSEQPIDRECITKDGKQEVFFKAKTCIYDLSPFEQTLFLDVDMIWLPNGARNNSVDNLFAELESVEFAMKNNGCMDMSSPDLYKHSFLWCSPTEVKEAYGFTDECYYDLHSELIYFTKSEANKAYFDTVKEIFDKPKLALGAWVQKQANQPKQLIEFSGDIPDEPAFSIACAIHKHYPHKLKWEPIYWEPSARNLNIAEINAGFYALSIGGNTFTSTTQNNYNNRAISLGAKYGFSAYNAQPKKSWNNQRTWV